MSARKGGRVLLCVDEGAASLAAARALQRDGWSVSVATWRDDAYAIRSAAVASAHRVGDPADDPMAYAESVAATADRLGVDVVLPATEGSLRALTGRDHLFACRVGVGTSSALDRATDKVWFQEQAAEAGLEVVETVELGPDSPNADWDRVALPAVVKPPRSLVAHSDGAFSVPPVRRVADRAQLTALVGGRGAPRWLVQPWIDGTLAAVCGVAWEGEIVCATHQVSPRVWPPGIGVTCLGVTVPRDDALEVAVARLVSAIGWSGVFQVQFLRCDDRVLAIDFNPRVYGSIGLAIAAGQSLPAIWARLVTGERPAPAPYRCGVRYRAEEDDFRVLLAARRSLGWRRVLREALPHRHTTHAVFSARDRRPSVVTLAKLAGRWRSE